jgi:hypothetical protein
LFPFDCPSVDYIFSLYFIILCDLGHTLWCDISRT